MKTPTQVLADVERRLSRTWASELVRAAGHPGAAPERTWSGEFALGQPGGAELAGDFGAAAESVATWRAWADTLQVPLRWRGRRVLGTAQEFPTHLLVADVDVAARLCGGVWPGRVERGRVRAAVLAARYPHLTRPASTLACVDGYDDVDFDLSCRAGDWFAANDARGLTPRQVPIEGLHAKWLNTRQELVRDLAGVASLRLLPPHPARIHFTYLDPGHLAGGGRRHDSATVGDRVCLAYRPRVVVISENKDTALHFPPVPGGVAVEGMGRGAAAAASFDWLVGAGVVVYWGDMDADGLEILNEFRAAGVPAVSLLMDVPAYETWRRFGTNVDVRGRLLESRPARPVPHLTPSELALYEQLISPSLGGHRRVEQERIPLAVASCELRKLLPR